MGPQDFQWAAPRGDRGYATSRQRRGVWELRLADRPDGDCFSKAENLAVVTFMRLARELQTIRTYRGLSVRELSAASKVAVSTITGLENGSAWGHLTTWVNLTDVLEADVCADNQPGVVAGLLREAATKQASPLDRVGHRWGVLSEAADRSPHTLRRLRRMADGGPGVSMATVLGLASQLGVEVTLVVRPVDGEE